MTFNNNLARRVLDDDGEIFLELKRKREEKAQKQHLRKQSVWKNRQNSPDKVESH